jgi:hypothetical protein
VTQVSGSIKCELIEGDPRYIRHTGPWSFYSDVLDDWCDAPAGFVNDTESVPLFRGSNREAGVGHDLVCRSDFKTREKGITPTKYQAAQVFWEIQDYYDEKESGNWLNRSWDWIKRYVKTGVVVVAWGYWHKFKVTATYEEIKA